MVRMNDLQPPLDVLIIGAGFSGVGAAIQLKAAGIDYLILEKTAAIGGVWRDNSYPDCACDIPSALYSYSFAPNPNWSHLFAKQPEIKQYCEDTARAFGIVERIRFGQELLTARWDAAESCWVVRTPDTDYRANFLIMACGPMHVPVTPRIPGLESFPGVQFHSSRWDHSVDLNGKRVAVIGSGASAIQFVPPIQPNVQKLTLFQRTAPWVLPKTDLVIPKSWQRVFQNYPLAQRFLRKMLYLQFEALNASLRYPALVTRLQAMGIRNIHRAIQDPGLRTRLTPNFSLGCKRILQSNTWYRALAKPNVEVVGGIREIQGQQLISDDGRCCEIDVLIFATGFEVAVPPIAHRIIGQSGTSLHARWDGSPQAYLGTMMEDCPNLFLTLGPNLYSFASAFTMIEAQVKFIVSAISTARRKQLKTIAVNPVINQTYNRAVQQSLQRTVWNSGCSSYFLDHHGRNSTNWPWTTFHLRSRLARFRLKEFLTR